MAIAREEIFGPVISVLPFDDDDEVVAGANDTDYGLGAVDLDPRRRPRTPSGRRRSRRATSG